MSPALSTIPDPGYHHRVNRVAFALLAAALALPAGAAVQTPPDAALVVSTDNAARMAARWRATPLGVLSGRADLAALVDLAATCPGPAVVWLAGDGSVAVIAEAGRAAEELAARLGAGAWPRWAGTEARPATLGGHPAALVSRQGIELGGWARVGPYLVASSSPIELESAVALATGVTTGAAPPAVPRGADLAVRVDLDRPPRPQPGRFDLLARLTPRPLDVLGRGATLSGVVRFDGALTRAEFSLSVRRPTGTAALLASLRGAAPRPALVPPDAKAFAAARLEPVAARVAAGEIFAAANPPLWLALTGAGAVAGRLSGHAPDPASRLLATFTGTLAWAETPDRPAAVALGVDPPGVAAEAAAGVLQPFAHHPDSGAAPRPEAERVLALPSPGGGPGLGLAWAVRRGWAVAALGPSDRVAAALPIWDDAPPTAWTEPELRAALGRLPRGAAALAAERLGGPVPGPLGRLLAVPPGEGGVLAVASARPAAPGRVDLVVRVGRTTR